MLLVAYLLLVVRPGGAPRKRVPEESEISLSTEENEEKIRRRSRLRPSDINKWDEKKIAHEPHAPFGLHIGLN